MTYYVQYLTNYGWDNWSRENDLASALYEALVAATDYQCIYRVVDDEGAIIDVCRPDEDRPTNFVSSKLRWQEVGF